MHTDILHIGILVLNPAGLDDEFYQRWEISPTHGSRQTAKDCVGRPKFAKEDPYLHCHSGHTTR
jgi:hypothetical protein